MTKEYLPCKKCGESHGIGIENMVTGEIDPIDYCLECLFQPYATKIIPNDVEDLEIARDFSAILNHLQKEILGEYE